MGTVKGGWPIGEDVFYIETTDEIPVQKQKELIEEQVQEMLNNDIIERSQSHTLRFTSRHCRKMSRTTLLHRFQSSKKKIKADAYPIPKIKDLACLEGARCFAEFLGKGKEKTS